MEQFAIKTFWKPGLLQNFFGLSIRIVRQMLDISDNYVSQSWKFSYNMAHTYRANIWNVNKQLHNNCKNQNKWILLSYPNKHNKMPISHAFWLGLLLVLVSTSGSLHCEHCVILMGSAPSWLDIWKICSVSWISHSKVH